MASTCLCQLVNMSKDLNARGKQKKKVLERETDLKLCLGNNDVTLCWFALTPQMTGGAEPPGLDTVKVSVRHWVDSDWPWVPPDTGTPFRVLVTTVVAVDGPATVKETKSRRIWQTSLLHGQIWTEHPPVTTVPLSK